MAKNILIVEDESTLRDSIKRLFQKDGLTVDSVGTAEEGLAFALDTRYDVILSDIILPGMDGIEMLRRIREQQPEQIVIVVTAYASLDTAIRALRAGAYDFIMKPILHDEIRKVVRNAMTEETLKRENALLRRQIPAPQDFSNIIGRNASLLSIIGEVGKVADTRSNILLLGETGTGKELFARIIHNLSARRDKPFVPINCSAIPETLLESELFGHTRGAFTGAIGPKLGLFEEADGGTVFLDEIGDIPLNIQVKLLRVLEDQEIRPVGSTKSGKVNIRLITATNRNLKEAVYSGTFREDLYYRVNVIQLELPPLKERTDDIPLLVEHFLRKYSSEIGKPVKEATAEAMALLQGYAWPGNIRELQNVIERAVLISDGNTITSQHLPGNIRNTVSFLDGSVRKVLSIEEYTRSFILKHQDNYTEQELAEKLGITRKTLWEKRKRWGIRR